MSKFYVYELYDPRDEIVFYVGKGQKGRIHQHEVEARKGRQSRKCDKIREIEAAGLSIGKRKVSKHAVELDAYEAEAALICEYGLARLTNVSPGGGGVFSAGPSVYEDRMTIVRATPLFQRTQAAIDRGGIAVLLPGLGRLELAWVMDMLHSSIRNISERRSLAWVNEIAAKHMVKFVPEPV